MNRNKEKYWQKDPNLVTENFEESDDCLEEDLIPLLEKEIVEGCLDNCDEPSYFFNTGAFLSFFFCLSFWAILYFLVT